MDMDHYLGLNTRSSSFVEIRKRIMIGNSSDDKILVPKTPKTKRKRRSKNKKKIPPVENVLPSTPKLKHVNKNKKVAKEDLIDAVRYAGKGKARTRHRLQLFDEILRRIGRHNRLPFHLTSPMLMETPLRDTVDGQFNKHVELKSPPRTILDLAQSKNITDFCQEISQNLKKSRHRIRTSHKKSATKPTRRVSFDTAAKPGGAGLPVANLFTARKEKSIALPTVKLEEPGLESSCDIPGVFKIAGSWKKSLITKRNEPKHLSADAIEYSKDPVARHLFERALKLSPPLDARSYNAFFRAQQQTTVPNPKSSHSILTQHSSLTRSGATSHKVNTITKAISPRRILRKLTAETAEVKFELAGDLLPPQGPNSGKHAMGLSKSADSRLKKHLHFTKNMLTEKGAGDNNKPTVPLQHSVPANLIKFRPHTLAHAMQVDGGGRKPHKTSKQMTDIEASPARPPPKTAPGFTRYGFRIRNGKGGSNGGAMGKSAHLVSKTHTKVEPLDLISHTTTNSVSRY